MPGRTDRVNARELSSRIEKITDEGEAIRSWIQQLVRRSSTALRSAKSNSFFVDNRSDEIAALEAVHEALKRADQALELVEQAAAERDSRAA